MDANNKQGQLGSGVLACTLLGLLLLPAVGCSTVQATVEGCPADGDVQSGSVTLGIATDDQTVIEIDTQADNGAVITNGSSAAPTITPTQDGTVTVTISVSTAEGTATTTCLFEALLGTGDCVVDSDCDDGDDCNGIEACTAGQCTGGEAVTCADGEPCVSGSCAAVCTTDADCPESQSCTDGACIAECLQDSDCDDGLFCNGTESCTDAMCVSGSDPCVDQLCEESESGAVCLGLEVQFTTGADDVSGTDGDDAFEALLSFDPDTETDIATLQTGDTLDGGAGDDTLTAELNGDSAAPMITNTETINVSAQSESTLDGSNILGLANLGFVDSAASLTASNLAGLVNLMISGIDDSAVDFTVGFGASAVSSADEVLTIAIDSATMGTISVDSVHRVALEATGGVSLAGISSDSLEELTIVQDGSLALGVVAAAGNGTIDLIDASSSTASVSGSCNDLKINAQVLLGSSNDSFSLGSSAGTNINLEGGDGDDSLVGSPQNDDIDGGAGNDTINGGGGADLIIGGDGLDTFQFDRSVASSGTAADDDVVVDWDDGPDIMALSAADTFGSSGSTGLASGGGAAGSLEPTPEGSVLVLTVSLSAGDSPIGESQFIKLREAVTAAGSEQVSFDAAIGTSTVLGLTNDVLIAGSFYDLTNEQAVIIEINSTNGSQSTIQSGDAVRVIARLAMTSTEYLNFTGNDIEIY